MLEKESTGFRCAECGAGKSENREGARERWKEMATGGMGGKRERKSQREDK
jgi:hypothetical protein